MSRNRMKSSDTPMHWFGAHLRQALRCGAIAVASAVTLAAAGAAERSGSHAAAHAPRGKAQAASAPVAANISAAEPLGQSAVVRDLLAGRDARPSVAEALAHPELLTKSLNTPAPQPSAFGEFAASLRDLQHAIDASRNAWTSAERAVAHRTLSASIDALRARKLLLDARIEQIDRLVADPKRPDIARQRWDAHRATLLADVTRIGDAAERAAAELAASGPGTVPLLSELASVLAAETRRSATPVFGATLPVFRPHFAARNPQTTPTIVPSYAESTFEVAPVPDDSVGSGDAPLSAAILAQAKSLGYDYTRIVDFVRGQVRTQWYAGAQKGADGTLRTLAGNDVDQASLLIALLRASGAPARYVRGTVDVPAADLAAMLGVRADEVALALGAAGVPNRPVVTAGKISGYAIEQVYVSAYLPFVNYRGTAADLDEPTWLPLMPALKPHAFTPAAGALARVGIGADAFVQQYLSALQTQSPLDLLRTQVGSSLSRLTPPLAYNDQLAKLGVSAEPLELLPADAPYPIEAEVDEFALLPDALRQHAHVVVRAGSDATDPIVLDRTFPVSQLADHRVTLSYEPASIDDGRLADSNSGQGNTPPYLIHLRPVLNVAGLPAASATGELESGSSHRIEITLDSPAGSASLSQVVTAGGIAAIVFDGQTDAPPLQDDSTLLPGESESAAARVLANFGARYLATWDQADDELARLVGVGVVRPLPSVALVINQYQVDRVDGVADRLVWWGVALDAALRPVEPFAQNPGDSASADWLRLASLQGSVLEHQLFEQQWAVDSISADKGLAIAQSNHAPIMTLTQATGTSGVNQPQDVLDTVGAWLNAGYVVDIPRDPLTYERWTGAVWRVRSLATGETGYFISGAFAGGSTAMPPDAWYFQDLADLLANAYAEDPDTDPLSGISITLDKSAQDQEGPVGTVLPKPLRALVVDAAGRPVLGAIVTFGVSQGNAKLVAGGTTATVVSVATNRNGLASASVQLDTKFGDFNAYRFYPDKTYPQLLGANVIEVAANASASTLYAGEPYKAYALPGAAAKVKFLGNNDFAPLGRGVGFAHYSLDVVDQYDNEISNAPLQASVSMAPGSCPTQIQPTLFVGTQCPAFTSLLTQLGCGTPSVSTTTGPGGTFVGLVPPDAGDGLMTVTATSSGATPTSIQSRLDVGSCNFFYPTVVEWLYVPSGTGANLIGATIAAAAPNAVAAVPQRFDVFEPDPNNTHQWIANSQATFTPDLTNGTLENTRYVGGGEYLQDLHVGPDPGPVLGTESIAIKMIGGLTAYTGFGPQTWGWSVDLKAPIVNPSPVPLTTFGATAAPMTLQTAGAPGEYRASPITIELLEGGNVLDILASPTDTLGTFVGEIERGHRFDNTKTHSARIVINDGTPFRMQSPETPIALGAGIVGGYGIVPHRSSGGTTVGNTRQPYSSVGSVLDELSLVQGRFPKKIEMKDSADGASGYSCSSGKQFDFVLVRDATVTLSLYNMDASGFVAAQPTLTVLDNVAFNQGLQTATILSSDLAAGEYQYQLVATATDGATETFKGPASRQTRRYDSLPLGNPFVKGVNLYNGGAVLSEEDIAIGGRGPGMKLTRTYTSHQGDVRGWFGRGWSSDLDMQVLTDDCDTRTVTGSAGQGQRFKPVSSTPDGVVTFEALSGYHGILVQTGAEYDFYAKDGTRYHFGQTDTAGPRLSYIQDTNGNRVAFTYEVNQGTAHVTQVTDAAGRQINLSYVQKIVSTQQQGFTFDDTFTVVETAKGPDGLQVDYSYDNDGNLTMVDRHDGSAKGERKQAYTYKNFGVSPTQAPDPDQNGVYNYGWRLMTATDQLDGGTRSYTYLPGWLALYDGAKTHYEPLQLVTQVEEPDHGQTQFTYLETTRGLVPVHTDVTDAMGHTTHYAMNRYGAAETVQDPVGTTTTEWDLNHFQPHIVTDALGTTTTYGYDSAGNKISESIHNGFGQVDRSWTYKPSSAFTNAPNVRNRVATATDGEGNETDFEYDANGNLAKTTRGGISESETYDPNGDHSSHTDGAKHQRKWSYDSYGYPAEADTPLGFKTLTTYDARGRKTNETDGNGHATTYTYDARDRLLTTTYPTTEAGRGVATSEYDDTADTRKDTNPNGHATTSYFDKMGRLVAVLHADGNSRSLQYDLVGNLTEETDFSSNRTDYIYDPANRRTEVHAPVGRLVKNTYDAVGHLTQESVFGPNSATHVTEYRYEHPLYKRTLVSRKGDAGNADETTDYDRNGNPTKITDPVGRITQRQYDARDRMVQEDAPYGRTTIDTYYDDDRLFTQTVKNPSHGDQVTTYTYDADGRLSATLDAVGDTRTVGYDRTKNVTSRSDARGNLTQYSYNARDQLIQEIGPENGQTTTYKNDLAGNRVDEVWPNGNERKSEYDVRERRTKTSDSVDDVESFTYTADDQVETRTDANGNTTTSTYDGLHRLQEQDLPAVPAGPRKLYKSYDVHGNLIGDTDARNNTTTYTYDKLGRRTVMQRPRTDVGSQVNYTYDLVDRPLSQQDERGNTTTWEYDDAVHSKTQHDPQTPDGTFSQTWTYDALGNEVSHVDRRGITTATEYDKVNRVTKVTRDSLSTSTRVYVKGLLDSDTDAKNRTISYKYDKAGRKVEEDRPLGATLKWTYTPMGDVDTATDADGRVTTNTYTPRRFLDSEELAGEQTKYTYFGEGQRKTQQRPMGASWTYHYDAGDRLDSVKDDAGHETTFAYDLNGNRTSQTDANHNTTTYEYDERNHRRTLKYPAISHGMAPQGGTGDTIGWTYDADGNLVELDTPHGATLKYDVDALNRTTDEKVTNPSSLLPEILTTTYQHDGNGNVLEIDESLSDSNQTKRTARRTYDNFDRLATSTDVHGRALSYAYDEVGNRTRTIDANGVDITHWDYDDLNRNVGVTADNATTKIDYKPSGRVLTITRPDGSTTTNDYDDAGRITSIQHAKGVPLAYTKYAYDLNGNRLTQTQGNGALTQHQLAGATTPDEVTTYTYDSSDWLTDIAVTDSGAHPIRTTHYVLDAVGNRTREQIRDGSGALIGDSTLQYNEREALYSRNDAVTGLHVDLTYDADGNTVSEIDGNGTRRFFYDAHDRMLQLYTADTALPMQFDYDSSGLRIAKQVSGGAATYYVYDGQSLLAETNTTGNPLAKYHYSATQLLTRTETSAGTRTRQYLLDALNTPIAILTSAGAIDSRTLYDAWGEIVSQQAFDANGSGGAVMTASTDGTYAELPNYDVQDVGFTGYIKDSESGLYYAKARYYDPRIARFTTVDPEEGKAMEPPSLHRYLYAYANPTVYTDPNGREVWDDRMALMNAMAAEDDPTKLAALRKDYGIAESRFNGRFKATMEEVRDTAVGVYQLGKNILKASYEASAVGYFNGAGTEGIDELGNGGKQLVNTIAHPIDKIYTPIHDQYVRANELDAQGNYFEGEYNRQKATLATENVVLTVASIPSAAKSFAKNLSKKFAQLSAADAKLVVETAGGDAASQTVHTPVSVNSGRSGELPSPPLTPDIVKGNNTEMLRQARSQVAALKADQETKIAEFERLAKQISDHSSGNWSMQPRINGTDQSAIYIGEGAPYILVINKEGQVYSGRNYLQSTERIGEAWTPKYDALQETKE